MQRLNVLVAAYACNPGRGSEEAVGWNWVQAIARNHDVTVLTAAFHAADIAAACDVNANPKFVFVPHRRWHYRPTPGWKRIEASIAKPIMNFAYALWQRDACRTARTLGANRPFDLAHQLTYVGFRFPGHLWRFGLPFVWGPIGGLENTPWRMLPVMGRKGAVYYAGRNIINSAQRRWLGSPRKAIAAAGPGLVAATRGIARELRQVYGADSTIINEVTAPLELSPAAPTPRQQGEPLRIAWSGLHLPGKALNLLLRALAGIDRDKRIELHVLGDGPMTGPWKQLAAELGVAEHCVWHGLVPRADALEVMGTAHVLAITSLKDLTSTVLLEGLALGLPVVCLDHCGFSDVVDADCGIKVPVETPDRVTAGLAAAIERMEADEATRMRMAEGALRRARAFSIDNLVASLQDVYAKVLERVPEFDCGAGSPHFFSGKARKAP